MPDWLKPNTPLPGYRGIWFSMGQDSRYGPKYSGGLGTYTCKHTPLAVHAPAVDRTFFVWGSTADPDQSRLVAAIGAFDHQTGRLSRPYTLLEKPGVNDPHDNPSLAIDRDGRLRVFVSGRGRKRMGILLRSREPYGIEAFDEVLRWEMTYPQPYPLENGSQFLFFTRYTGVRELYWTLSPDGTDWPEPAKLAGMGGHYQVSNRFGDRHATAFNRHPDGHPDGRTDLYYLETPDAGRTWQTIDGRQLETPLTEPESPARILTNRADGRFTYMKDLQFTPDGRPLVLVVTSGHHQPGPVGAPRRVEVVAWTGSDWQVQPVCETTNNYDSGCLRIHDADTWTVTGPHLPGPQHWGTGGEVGVWTTRDAGAVWTLTATLTTGSERNHAYVRGVRGGQGAFTAFWADGDPHFFSDSHLYFTDADNRVFRMPPVTREDWEEPEPWTGGSA